MCSPLPTTTHYTIHLCQRNTTVHPFQHNVEICRNNDTCEYDYLGVMVHQCLQGMDRQYLTDSCTMTSDISQLSESPSDLLPSTHHQLNVPWHYCRFGRWASFVACPLSEDLISTRGNRYKHHSHYDLRKFNFTNRVIPIWNSLSDYVVSAGTINTFKNRSKTDFGLSGCTLWL